MKSAPRRAGSSRCRFVGAECCLGCGLATEAFCLTEARRADRVATPGITYEMGQCIADGRDLKRLDIDGRLPGHLGQRASPRGDHRATGGHRFEHGKAESLIERRERQTERMLVEPEEELRSHFSEDVDLCVVG